MDTLSILQNDTIYSKTIVSKIIQSVYVCFKILQYLLKIPLSKTLVFLQILICNRLRNISTFTYMRLNMLDISQL